MKNAKFGIFSEITLPPDQGTSSQAKRVNINGQKMTLARSALSTSLYLFDERKCLHLILAAPTFGYFHFGYLNKWRDLWVSSRLRGNKQKFFSTTMLAAFGLIRRNSRNNYNYPSWLVKRQFPSSINPFLIGSRSHAASLGLTRLDESQLYSHNFNPRQNCQLWQIYWGLPQSLHVRKGINWK